MVSRVGREKYEVTFETKKVGELRLIDPSTVVDENDATNYLVMTDIASKQMTSIYELGNKKFSKDLYEIDQDLWKQLVAKKRLSNNVIENIRDSVALIIGDSILNISHDTDSLPKSLSVINQYVTDDELEIYSTVNPEDNTITVIAIDSDKVGNLVKYYIKDNWFTIYDCYYDHHKSRLFIAPLPEVNAEASDEILEVCSKDTCYNSSKNTMLDLLENIINTLSSTFLSCEEVIGILKKNLGLKLKYDEPDVLEFSTNNDYSSLANENLQAIITKLYTDEQFVSRVNSHWMKRAIYITSVSYFDICNLLTSLMRDDKVDSSVVCKIIIDCMEGNNHYTYLNS